MSTRCPSFLDINNFKQVNDTYGHENGNVLWSEIAKLISGEVTALILLSAPQIGYRGAIRRRRVCGYPDRDAERRGPNRRGENPGNVESHRFNLKNSLSRPSA